MEYATPFTPWSALAGGALIGLASVLLMALNGRIAGISGIAGGLIGPATPDRGWRAAFIAGLVLAPLVYTLAAGEAPAVEFPVNTALLIAGGALVGLGTQLGSGCTSGHGVCGMSRLSPRSIAATAVFMTTGFATVFVVRHVF
ncbi:YeeE/YedE family protein [Marinicauda algicola]|uniref:YeeE/YedE family protein n=1 Tax=Marinicauda algicola TaxID=2029849 RepID=A0A4V3RYI2_9PROT|nr:YeeE/YedE family protein [Marinicauda algicola]TGY90399.1 YeeE/YedE family protein [Marinicauda algicola]